MADKDEADSTDESTPSAADDAPKSESADEVTDEAAAEPSNTVSSKEGLAESDDSEDGDDDSERELVSVGPAGLSENGDVAKNGPSKKDKATPKQKQPAEKVKRATPPQFIRESVGELQKVVYPTGQQLLRYFVVVLVFVLFIIGIVSLLDLGFGWAIFQVFS